VAGLAFTRRGFLRRSALAAGALALPGGIAAAQGGFDTRLGFIGLGFRGLELLRASPSLVTGLCDADAARLADAAQIAGKHLPQTQHYRELLARADIDAVVIATPDHTHAMLAVHACEAGKHVFLETPLCRKLDEGQRIARAARQYGRSVHASGTGAGGASRVLADALRGWMASAAPDAPLEVSLFAPENPQGGDPTLMQAPPDTLDWDSWLGPAPYHPYNPGYAHLNWRWMMELGGGQMRQQGAPLLAAVLAARGVGDLGVVEVTAEGAAPEAGLWDCPPRISARWELPALDTRVIWEQNAEQRVGLRVTDGARACQAERTTEGFDWRAEAEGNAAPLAVAPRTELENWLSRLDEADTGLLAQADQAAALANLANLSWTLGRPLRYDFATQTFENDPAAQRFIGELGRGGYHW